MALHTAAIYLLCLSTCITIGFGLRPGTPPQTTRCDQITSVPRELTFITRYPFYRKYTHAYGIPIISSYYSDDAALKRACYNVKVLLADNPKIRYWMYKNYGRLGIIGRNEGTRSIPEHSYLPPWWDQRARGLGGTMAIPISTGGEENLLCLQSDRYRSEDIAMHEFFHGIANVGVASAIPGWIGRLKAAYNAAKYRGLWRNTYAMSTWEEYFAEGAQSYFHVNAYANPPNGIHNDINTRAKLRRYDPTLYNLVREVFPCENWILDRCKKGQTPPSLKMNCANGGGTVVTSAPVTGGPQPTDGPQPSGGPQTSKPPSGCTDSHRNCQSWARQGECNKNPSWMKVNCKKSCNTCDGTGGGGNSNCKDKMQHCPAWAQAGYCKQQSVIDNCKKSCNLC